MLVLRRAPATPTAAARPDAVEVSRYDTDTAAADAYNGGALDLAPLPADTVTGLVRPGVGVVRVSPAAALWWIAADTTDPVLSSVELRRGLGHVADRSAIVIADLPGRRLLDGLFPPQLPGGVDKACGANCTVDPAATTAAVTAASPSGPPTLLLDTPDSAGPSASMAAFASSLGSAGIPTSVRTRTVRRVPRPGPHRRPPALLVRLGRGGGDPGGLPPGVVPHRLAGQRHRPGITGGRRRHPGRPVHRRPVRAGRPAGPTAEKLVLDLMPVVPLAQAQNATALSAAVQGFVQRLDGSFAIDRIWLAAS